MQPDVLALIHRWDVFTFQRIMSSRLQRSLVDSAFKISRTADGWLYPLVPAFLYLIGHPVAGSFFLCALIAYGVERSVYTCAKKGFRRPRPQNALPGYTSHINASDEFSFPSGHTSAAFLMVTLLILFFGWTLAFLYLWAISVAFSRILLGVHFPTDTIVGACMGAGLAVIVYRIFILLG